MTQRSQSNPRNLARQKHGEGLKGTTRKSASSAKIASKAGSSVYTKTAKSAAKGKSKLEKAVDEDARKTQRQRERRREQALGAQLNTMPEYKKWRRIWWIVLAVAVAACVVSFLMGRVRNWGVIDEGVANAVSVVTLILGYAGIIGALFIDLGKIRRMRKDLQAQAHTMSKKQLRQLDAAIEEGDKKYEEERKQRKSRMPWGKKTQTADETEETNE